jgi:hypothetical protein
LAPLWLGCVVFVIATVVLWFLWRWWFTAAVFFSFAYLTMGGLAVFTGTPMKWAVSIALAAATFLVLMLHLTV